MSTTAMRRSAAALVLTAAAAAPLAAAGPAQAKGGGSPAIKASGACVGGGTWTLKAKHDDGRIEVEYEVEANRAGQLWHVDVALTDNNATVLSANKRTVAPSGSFSVRVLIADRAGVDTIRAHATFAARSCAGSVRV